MSGDDPLATEGRRRRHMTRGRLMTMTLAPIAVTLVIILGVSITTNTERAIATSKHEMAGAVRTLSETASRDARHSAPTSSATASHLTV